MLDVIIACNPFVPGDLTNVVRTEDPFQNIFGIIHEVTKYLEGNCGLGAN